MSKRPRTDVDTIHDYGIDVGRRFVYLFGDIDDDSCRQIIINIQYLDETDGDITLWISSVGGDSTGGMGAYDVVKGARNRVIGRAVGDVSSAAAIIMQGCTERIMSHNSVMMVHDGSDKDDDKIRSVLRRAKWLEEAMNRDYKIYAERTGLSIEKLIDLCRDDTYLFAEDALKLGFIDKIE